MNKDKESTGNLKPVHLNKARCSTHFWDWNTKGKVWVKGAEIPEKLKRMYESPPSKSNYL